MILQLPGVNRDACLVCSKRAAAHTWRSAAVFLEICLGCSCGAASAGHQNGTKPQQRSAGINSRRRDAARRVRCRGWHGCHQILRAATSCKAPPGSSAEGASLLLYQADGSCLRTMHSHVLNEPVLSADIKHQKKIWHLQASRAPAFAFSDACSVQQSAMPDYKVWWLQDMDTCLTRPLKRMPGPLFLCTHEIGPVARPCMNAEASRTFRASHCICPCLFALLCCSMLIDGSCWIR